MPKSIFAVFIELSQTTSRISTLIHYPDKDRAFLLSFCEVKIPLLLFSRKFGSVINNSGFQIPKIDLGH